MKVGTTENESKNESPSWNEKQTLSKSAAHRRTPSTDTSHGSTPTREPGGRLSASHREMEGSSPGRPVAWRTSRIIFHGGRSSFSACEK